MSSLRPLSEGNRFQRRYAAWAAPYYERMPAEARESAEMLDRFLYSRRGLGVWIGLLCAVAGSAFGLRGAGLPAWLAVMLSLLVWFVIPFIGLTAWLMPSSVLTRKPLKKYIAGVGLGALGALAGFTVGHVARRGQLDGAELGSALLRNLPLIAPVVLLVIFGMGLLMWGVAHIRRSILQQELERTSLAREAAEARLRLLQGQIQPHFLFNTLSALQHWVDTGDARAPGLLRSLSGFLRGSTDLLGHREVTIEAEAAIVAHYLAIQQARLGERLKSHIDIAPDAARSRIPPGLLLTLVENAVEHGVSPTLGGGTVQLSAHHEADALVIDVVDDGVGLPPGWTERVGLANCRQRLAHHFGHRARLSVTPQDQGTRARITIEERAS